MLADDSMDRRQPNAGTLEFGIGMQPLEHAE
jgi:hypothetical protein